MTNAYNQGRRGETIHGVFIDAVDWDQVFDTLARWEANRESRYACLCNVHSVVTSAGDPRLKAALDGADLALPDGFPVGFMLRRLGYPKQQRISGPDLMWEALRRAEADGRAVLFFGSTQDTLDKLAIKLRDAFPALKVAASISPPFRPVDTAFQPEEAAAINAANASLVFVGLGLPMERTWDGVGAENKIRVLGSSDTLAIAMGGVAMLAGGTRAAGFKSLILGNIFLLTVVVLQHRSVWVATLVALAILAILARRARPILLKQAAAMAVIVPLFFAIAVAAGMDTKPLTESIAKSTETGITGEGTFEAREVGWQGLLEGYNRAQLIDRVLGAPMGSGYLRFTRGVYDPRVQFSPHNFYVQVLLRGGILGELLFAVALALAAWRAVRTARQTGNAVSHWLAAAVFMSMAFFIPYGAFVPTGLAIGLAQARIGRDDAEPDPAKA